MTIRLLEQICDTLKQADLAQSEQDFCQRWLAKSECYMRTLRFNNLEPSAEALATLGSKLGYYAVELARHRDDRSKHWSHELDQMRLETQSALELRVRERWQAVCAHKAQLRKISA